MTEQTVTLRHGGTVTLVHIAGDETGPGYFVLKSSNPKIHEEALIMRPDPVVVDMFLEIFSYQKGLKT